MTVSPASRPPRPGAPAEGADGRTTPRRVSSHTEWDTLHEVVVGRLAGGVFPTWQESMAPVLPEGSRRLLRERGGLPLPAEHLAAAERELEGLATALTAEGVSVVRPDAFGHERPFATPDWESAGGLYAGMPRDLLMVVGDVLIEAPLSWRCRQHEVDAFRPLLKRYFREGARWLAAPRPQLTDDLFRTVPPGPGEAGVRWAVNDFEPVFDAADFLKFGADLVVQRSHVTNAFGIEWLRRALGPGITVHTVETRDPHAMHIDATMMPLAPGKLLVHPERYVPHPLFDGWEVLTAPRPTLPDDWPMYFCSPWVSMNVLSLDEETVVVESHEEPLIEALEKWGFRCIPLDFRHVYSFGGSFHCVTLDTVRSGGPGRYLNRPAGSDV